MNFLEVKQKLLPVSKSSHKGFIYVIYWICNKLQFCGVQASNVYLKHRLIFTKTLPHSHNILLQKTYEEVWETNEMTTQPDEFDTAVLYSYDPNVTGNG